VQYTTIQNWSNNVYNLVTKRMAVYKDAVGYWLDANIGSKLTMKYPSCYLMEPGARGEILSVAIAGKGQHQDAGGKIIHGAPNTSSVINSKSISKDGGRTSYRGLIKVYPGCEGVKSTVRCDALLMDEDSRSDTYPSMEIDEENVQIGHEATVSKVSDDQIFYLMSRGIPEQDATKMIVNGFLEPLVKQLPMEYAVELNRLVEMQLEGSVG
jgi:Fe-S cluster assembly protein SufB